jgi:threonylcarbamoyladenosine tRNA methylthiotransferase MtaB
VTLRLCIRTVGCRTNQADSLALEMTGRAAGFGMTDDVGQADVVIVNSCAVTARAARDVRRMVRQARRLAPGAEVIVTGCLVEIERPELWDALGATRVVPNAHKMQALAPHGRCGRPAPPVLRTFRPALKVQEGCSVGCAYCVVPRTRGTQRSRPTGQVLADASRLASAGACEVVLTGTQLGAWGRDLSPPGSLADLVERFLLERPVPRTRLSSLEPWGCDGRLLALLAAGSVGLCRHLHVPLQSGSDRIHEAMGRPGRPEAWASLVERIAAMDRGVALGTDVLVGFPGETREDFDATREMVSGLPVAYLHVFPFSPRPSTRASRLGRRPGEAEVRGRVDELRALSVELRTRFLKGLVGSVLEVVVERSRRSGPGVVGTSSEYVRVVIEDGRSGHLGATVNARAESVQGERVVARLEEVVE